MAGSLFLWTVTIVAAFSAANSANEHRGAGDPSVWCRNNLAVITTEERGESRAWVLCIAPKEAAAVIFLPPNVVKMRSLETAPIGRFRFVTENVPGSQEYYEFVGTNQEGRLTGKILRHTSDYALTVEESSAVGLLLSPRDGTLKLTRFSNRSFVNETGDLLGADVIVIDDRGKLSGVICFYEDHWGEPRFVPLAMQQFVTEKATGVMRFHIAFRGGMASYELRSSPRSATLKRLDPPQHLSGQTEIKLHRMKRIF